MKETQVRRGELPNPAFARENWQILNGIWDFSFDCEDVYETLGIESIAWDKKSAFRFAMNRF